VPDPGLTPGPGGIPTGGDTNGDGFFDGCDGTSLWFRVQVLEGAESSYSNLAVPLAFTDNSLVVNNLTTNPRTISFGPCNGATDYPVTFP